MKNTSMNISLFDSCEQFFEMIKQRLLWSYGEETDVGVKSNVKGLGARLT